MKLKLIKASKEYKEQICEMLDEWYITGEKIVPYAIRRIDYHDFDYYMNNLECKGNVPEYVADSTFFCLDEERDVVVGAVNIRHYLNELLLKNGGHIGDGVRPSDRGKGIANEMIGLALKECWRLGIYKVLMVCSEDNPASAKSIINNGGVLEDEVEVDGVIEQRYWIDLTREKQAEEIPDAIRHMSFEEIFSAVDVIRKAFKTVADEFGFTEENAPRFTAFATDEQRIGYQFLEEHKPMYVYLLGGKIVGYYSLAILNENEVELNNLAVLPEYRHNGIGRKLLNDCFERVKALGADKLKIGIVEENQVLRKWYESNGFIHTGTVKFDFFPFTCGYMEADINEIKKD